MVGIGLLWVAIVPMFEAPDETMHFDYVFALASKGGVLRGTDGPPGFRKQVLRAMTAAGIGRIAFAPSEKVDYSYGTPEFFKNLNDDEIKSALSDGLPVGSTIPHLLSVYPIGAYAAYAFLVRPFRPNLVAMFYVARYCSIAFGVVGLILWAIVLRKLRISRLAVLALITAAALSPLTAFVSGYVQPDNVAMITMPLVILAALGIGRQPLNWGLIALYAFSLAALYLTKPHFFLSVFAATLPILIFATKHMSPRARATCVVLTLFPSAGAAALDRWITFGAQSANYYGGSLTGGLSQAVRAGPVSVIYDLYAASLYAFQDYFFGGRTQLSYWGDFGWLDTPIVIINAPVTALLRTIIAWGTFVVLVAFVVVVLRNFRRLIDVGKRRSWNAAGALAIRNPAVNAYMLFAAIMVTLYISSNDYFIAQGRNWYPFQVVALLVPIVYAPRIITRHRVRGYVTFAVATALLTFACLGSASAILTIEDRYYRYDGAVELPEASKMPQLPQTAEIQVDAVDLPSEGSSNARTPRRPDLMKALHVESGARGTLMGWAVDPGTNAPCQATFATIDGRFMAWGTRYRERPDVVATTGNARLLTSGYRVPFQLPPKLRGQHLIGISCVTGDYSAVFAATKASRVIVGS